MSIASALRALGARLPSESALVRHGTGQGFAQLNDQAMENVREVTGYTRLDSSGFQTGPRSHRTAMRAPFGLETIQAVEPMWLSLRDPDASLSKLSIGTPTSASLDSGEVQRWLTNLERRPAWEQDSILSDPANRVAVHHVHPLPDDPASFDGAQWSPWVPLSPADISFAREPVIGPMFAHMSTKAPAWDAAAVSDAARGIDRFDFRQALQDAHDVSLRSVSGDLGYRGDLDSVMAGVVRGDPQAFGLVGMTQEGAGRAAQRAGLIERDSAFGPEVAASLQRFQPVIEAAEAAALQIFDRRFGSLTRDQKLTVLAMIGAGGMADQILGDPASSQTAMASA